MSVRIFTVQEELPFAGHPTLGTAFALRGRCATSDADRGDERRTAREVVLELNVGKVPVTFEDNAGEPAFGEMTQIDPTFGMQHEREAVARATGLRVDDFDDSLPIETVSTGLAYTVTPLKSLAVMQNLQIDLNRAAEYLEKTGGKFFYFVTRETVDREPVSMPACFSTTARTRLLARPQVAPLHGWWPTAWRSPTNECSSSRASR